MKKRIGLYALAVVLMTVSVAVDHTTLWQGVLAGVLCAVAGAIIYVVVEDERWSRVRVPKQSMRRLSSSLYNMTPEQQYRAQKIDEAAKRHEAMINNIPHVGGKTINLIAEDEWLGQEEEEDPYLEQRTIAWLKDRFPAPEDRDGA